MENINCTNKILVTGGAGFIGSNLVDYLYTSNLVKMGFTSVNRNITEAGCSYLKGSVTRDALEQMLPLDSINIALLRQLIKLRIFSTPNAEGKRQYYSPVLLALVLLLDGQTIDKSTFGTIVQGITPYSKDTIKSAVSNNTISVSELEESIRNIPIVVPEQLIGITNMEYGVFENIFKGSKNNGSTSKTYYDFFIALKNFRDNINEETYTNLLKCFDDNASMLNKAFGYGKSVFNIGNRGGRLSLEEFIEKNSGHTLIYSASYITEFYIAFAKSKWIDGIREYSDTTIRLLSATGLFKFRNLPELSYKEILSIIFDTKQMRESIFGEMSEEEFIEYERAEKCYYGKGLSISQIFHYSHDDISGIVKKIECHLGVSDVTSAKALLKHRKNAEFMSYIDEKYHRDKIMELLPLFSDRKNDSRIKQEVNDSATVPTIYEYIIGIAWYYLSNKE